MYSTPTGARGGLVSGHLCVSGHPCVGDTLRQKKQTRLEERALEHTKRTTGAFAARTHRFCRVGLASSVAAGMFWLCRASRIFSMQPRASLESLQQHDHPHMRPLPYAAADAAMRDPAALLFRCKRARLAPLAGSSNLGLTISPSTLLSERPATSDRLPNWPAHELVDRFSRLLRRNSHQHERLELKRAEGREQRGRPPGVRPPQAPRSSDRARATASYPLA